MTTEGSIEAPDATSGSESDPNEASSPHQLTSVPRVAPGLPTPTPHPTSGRSAAEAGDEYDRAVNHRRLKLAYVLLFAASLSFLGTIALLVLVVIGWVAAANIALPVTSLALLTVFLIGSARRDFVPYQFLHQSRDTNIKDPTDRMRDAADLLKMLKSGE